jgi:hypothetical protein
MHGFLELLLVERLRVVVVSDLEFLANTLDSSGTSCSNSSSNVLNNLGFISIGCETSFSLNLLWFWSVENVVVLFGSWLIIGTSPSLSSLTLLGLVSEFPGIADHGHEIHVIIDRA